MSLLLSRGAVVFTFFVVFVVVAIEVDDILCVLFLSLEGALSLLFLGIRSESVSVATVDCFTVLVTVSTVDLLLL